MDIRKMALALALPLALGIASCRTSESSRTAQSEGTAPAPTSTGAEGGAVATPGQTGQTTPGEATQGGTSHGTSGSATARDDGTLTGEHGASTGMGSDIKGHASDRVVMGTVSSMTSGTLSIASDTGGAAKTLHVVPETIITVDGVDARISDIKEGEQVRASFSEQEGRQVAVKIEAGPSTMGGTGTSADTPPADTATPSQPGTSGTSGSSDTSGTGR
jgi:hypothetical protein